MLRQLASVATYNLCGCSRKADDERQADRSLKSSFLELYSELACEIAVIAYAFHRYRLYLYQSCRLRPLLPTELNTWLKVLLKIFSVFLSVFPLAVLSSWLHPPSKGLLCQVLLIRLCGVSISFQLSKKNPPLLFLILPPSLFSQIPALALIK